MLIVSLLCKNKNRLWVGALCGYVFLIVSITVLSRKGFAGTHFQPELFWSWREWKHQKSQIIWNVLAFIPIGAVGGKVFRWRIIPIAAAFSLCIEFAQLVSRRGLFEFDDVMHNTIGALIGYLICFIVIKAWKIGRD